MITNNNQRVAEANLRLAVDITERKGWAVARLIAASVERNANDGVNDRWSDPEGSVTDGTLSEKVSINKATQILRMGDKTISGYLRAWDRAAEDHLCTPATDLTPDDGHTASLPDADWSECYVSTNTGTTRDDIQDRVHQQPPALPPMGSPEVREFVQEAIKSDSTVAATADQALEDRTKENAPPRKETPESNRDHHQYELAALVQVRKIRRESKALASMVHDLDGTARDAVTTTLAECIDVLEIIKASLQGEESMDTALAALLNEEG